MSVAQVIALRQGLEAIKQQQALANKQPTITQPGGTPQPYTGMSPTGPDPATTPYRVVQNQGGSSSLYVQQGYKATLTGQSVGPSGETVKQYQIEPVLPKSTSQPLSNDLFSGKRQGLSLPFLDMGTTQPVIKNNEQRLEAIVTIATLPIGGGAMQIAKNAIIGGSLNTGMNYLLNGKATPENFVEGAVGGVVLGGISNKAAQVLKITGQGLAPAVARVGLNTSIGGGAGAVIEVASGKITGKEIASGVLFGAGLGAAGEAFGAAGPKVNSRIAPRVQKNIDTKYLNAVTENKPFKPSLLEKAGMKLTGVKPSSLAQDYVALKTIPNAPTDNFENYQGYRAVDSKNFSESFYPIYNKSGKLIDLIDMRKTGAEVPATLSREKPLQPDNFKSIAEMDLQKRVSVQASMADASSVIYGQSQGREAFYAKAPAKPFPAMRYNGKELVIDSKLGFSKRINGVIDFDVYSFKQPVRQNAKTVEPAKPISGNGLVTKQEQSALIKELTVGEAAQPTGVSKTISDMQTGRQVSTAKTILQSPKSSFLTIAPSKAETTQKEASRINGISVRSSTRAGLYPGTQRKQQFDEEETYLSYPKSILPQPVILTRTKTDNKELAATVPILSIAAKSKQKGMLNLNTPLVTPLFTQDVTEMMRVDLAPRVEQRNALLTQPVQITRQRQQQTPIDDVTTIENNFGSARSRTINTFTPTSKLDFGPTRPSNDKKLVGIGKRVRYYAVADPEKVYGEFF